MYKIYLLLTIIAAAASPLLLYFWRLETRNDLKSNRKNNTPTPINWWQVMSVSKAQCISPQQKKKKQSFFINLFIWLVAFLLLFSTLSQWCVIFSRQCFIYTFLRLCLVKTPAKVIDLYNVIMSDFPSWYSSAAVLCYFFSDIIISTKLKGKQILFSFWKFNFQLNFRFKSKFWL